MSERPVECSQCKKEASICYKEVMGDCILETQMCKDCPFLKRRLKGDPTADINKEKESSASGLCCGCCGTKLEVVLTSNPLGCPECYEVFSEVIINELERRNKIGFSFKKKVLPSFSQSVHIGKTPGKTAQISASSKLTALGEALNDALKKENYEEAAWLRDQIKQLTVKDDSSKQTP